MLAAFVNGSRVVDSKHALDIEERGLAYGDGVFETMLLRNGKIRFLSDHLTRLRAGCSRLKITVPTDDELQKDFASISREHRNGIVKLIVTRGVGSRGYRSPEEISPTRIVIVYPPIEKKDQAGIVVRWCETRLPRNSQLAGIKHLNRLEQVVAQNEWRDVTIADGLMLDTEGEVVEAITSNLFAVIDGVLTTPDLRFCGVRGVMRERVLAIARTLDIETQESTLRTDDVLSAQEVFLTNAVRGIRPVCALDDRRWPIGPMTRRLIDALESTE